MSNTVNIISLGKYLPQKKVNVNNIKEEESLSAEKLERTGIKSVYVANDEEQPCYMAIEAAREAMLNANIKGDEIDLVIYTMGFIPEYLMFADHAYIQNKLGIKNASSFKIEQGCNGVISGIEIAKSLLLTNNYKNILIVAADKFNEQFINKWTASPFCFYGDGASAAILSTNGTQMKVLSTAIHTDGAYSMMNYVECGNMCPPTVESVNERLHVFNSRKIASKFWKGREEERKNFYTEFICMQKKILDESLKKANLKLQDLDYLVMYNISLEHYRRIFQIVDFPPEKTSYKLASKYGHMGVVDLFVNLKDEIELGKIKTGDTVGLLCAGAGYTWGSCILKI